ncbi:hypothetical protein Ciccas_005526 [Cichlidogyrus casuarinus]|uniref:Uncharacterized protein n=1 Tax=Cichlidogyrus casuarinus TaxID=1844966 RepID=A0ABD2Q8E5_9PLAT
MTESERLLDESNYIVGRLDVPDVSVIGVYFAVLFAVGIYSSCVNRGSVTGYFLAGRSMHWIPVGFSLFASNIGSGHFIGLAGSAAATGIGVGMFELNAIFVLIILGWIFAPVYISARVYTMPEYLYKRFGGQRIRIYLSTLTLLLYVATKISAVLMVAGALYLAITSFQATGGYEELLKSFLDSVSNSTRVYRGNVYHAAIEPNSSLVPDLFAPNHTIKGDFSGCSLPSSDALNLIKAIDDPDLPWPGVIFGITILGIWYWCSDQVIVQRLLSAKNITHAKAGVLLAAAIKLLPLYLLVFPGMAARVLFPDDVACNIPEKCREICSKPLGCSDIAYPKLVLHLMPSGARGLMLSVMLSSLVSSLTSVFNSASVLFTMDIWKSVRPKAGDNEIMVIGRLSVLVLVLISIAWIPIVKSSEELFHYIQRISALLSAPVAAVYILAIFWKRATETGAFYTLISGFFIASIRFFIEVAYPPVPCGHDQFIPQVLTQMHYLHFAILLFTISLLINWMVSINTQPLPEQNVSCPSTVQTVCRLTKNCFGIGTFPTEGTWIRAQR